MARRVHHFTTSRYGGSAEITGYRDGAGAWNQLNPRTGQWFVGGGEPGEGTRHRGRAPNSADLEEGRAFGVHIRYRGRDYFYTYRTPVGITGAEIEQDFRRRVRAGYFRRYGTRR